MEIYPVIMAGGSGTRFWPASRTHLPKQFLNIFGSKTMIEQTIERVTPLTGEEKIIIVGNVVHHELLEKIRGPKRYVLLEEPFGRNTAPCIGLAAVYLRKRGVISEPLAVLPADHFIADEKRFLGILSMAGRLAAEGSIVTIGIVPSRPETGYGYLKKGAVRYQKEGVDICEIKRFVEKPGGDEALAYVKSGDYLWNSGIFVMTPETILKEIQVHLPEVYEGLLEIEQGLGEKNEREILRSAYENFPSISIDYGIMEKTDHPILVLPGDFGWSDVGSWGSLYGLRKTEADDHGNVVQGEGMLFETDSCFIFNAASKIVAGVGLKGLVIVNTDDALLVADMKRSQDIKNVIEALRQKGLDTVL